MVDRRPSAGEAEALNLTHYESVSQALEHLEAAIEKVAAGVRALSGQHDLFSSRPDPHSDLDRLAAEHAALKARHEALSREHADLQQRYNTLLKRQAEAYDRIGAVMERLRRVLPDVVDDMSGNNGKE